MFSNFSNDSIKEIVAPFIEYIRIKSLPYLILLYGLLILQITLSFIILMKN